MVHTAVPRPILWYYVITALIDNILSRVVVLAKLDLHWFEHVRNHVTQLVQFDSNVSRTFRMLIKIIANLIKIIRSQKCGHRGSLSSLTVSVFICYIFQVFFGQRVCLFLSFFILLICSNELVCTFKLMKRINNKNLAFGQNTYVLEAPWIIWPPLVNKIIQ